MNTMSTLYKEQEGDTFPIIFSLLFELIFMIQWWFTLIKSYTFWKKCQSDTERLLNIFENWNQ